MSTRAHLFEIIDKSQCLGNEERLIARLDAYIWGYDFDYSRDSIVISRDNMEEIVKKLREIHKEDGDMWEWAKNECATDIAMFGDEDAWRRWCSDLADDIEQSLKDSKSNDFLIWYF